MKKVQDREDREEQKMLIWCSDYWSVSQQKSCFARIIFIISRRQNASMQCFTRVELPGIEVRNFVCYLIRFPSLFIWKGGDDVVARVLFWLIYQTVMSWKTRTRKKGVDCVREIEKMNDVLRVIATYQIFNLNEQFKSQL